MVGAWLPRVHSTDSEDGPSFARVSSLASRLDDRLRRIVARTRFVTRGGTYRRKFPDLKQKKLAHLRPQTIGI